LAKNKFDINIKANKNKNINSINIPIDSIIKEFIKKLTYTIRLFLVKEELFLILVLNLVV